MKKLIKFIKYNKMIVLPFVLFLFFLILGIVEGYMPLVYIASGFMLILTVSLIVTLKDYK